ncbi:phosphatase [Psychromonas hadalis]|uniref:phosphatase n=1 Tax=Psychromonas hadalis TaxID=211669 RepID=UPI0003B6C90D|nr:phosphatase [Psychromonas hadalis]
MKILCDTHSHTVASTHAYSTVHDYITSAKINGLQLFSLTDHAPSMPDSPHMWHFGNMQVIPRIVDDIAILRGIEANIMNAPYEHATQRNVDLPDSLLPYLDFAIASFHEPVFPPAGIKENTKAAIQAIESGVIQIMGHLGNPNYPLYQEEIVRAAKDNNVLIEINNSSFNHSRNGSAPFCVSLIEFVDKHSWKVSVGSDAHISFQVGIFDQAIEALQRVNFNEKNIANRTPAAFIDFLSEHGKSVAEELQPWLKNLNK